MQRSLRHRPASFSLAQISHPRLDLRYLLVELVDLLLDVLHIIRQLPFRAVVSEKLDFAVADL